MPNKSDKKGAPVEAERAQGRHSASSAALHVPAASGEQVDSVTLKAWRKARRIVVFIVGGTLLLMGVVLLVLPGPAFIVIPAGLAILAIEFRWARRWLRRARSLLPDGHHGEAGKPRPKQ